MKTITVQIGNSDDKLTQKMWSLFVDEMDSAINLLADGVHFSGGSPARTQWQNYAWVFTISDNAHKSALCRKITIIRQGYKQNSVAWTEGETLLV